MEDLKQIAAEFHRRVLDKPGLGAVMIFFESRDHRATPPAALVILGKDPLKAVQMIREQADLVEKAEGEQSPIITAPTIIKPS